jgi:hypothetical protein
LNRSDLARRYANAYVRLDPTGVNAASIRLAALMLDPDRLRALERAQAIDTASNLALFRAGLEHLGSWTDSAETAIRLLRALAAETGREPGKDWVADTLMHKQFLAGMLAYRGRLQEAYAVDVSLLLAPNASPFSAFSDPFLNLVLLGVIPDSLATANFRLALRPGKAWPLTPFLIPRQLRGLPWWLARKDTASLAAFALRAGQETRRQASSRGKLLARYLHAAAMAYLALARADSTEALRRFQAIPDTLCIASDCFYEKLTEARLLNGLGQARQAGAVLDRWIWSGEGPFFVLGVLERGRIAEGLGERQKARDSYQFVVDVWRHADPELELYVREARARLERLAAES